MCGEFSHKSQWLSMSTRGEISRVFVKEVATAPCNVYKMSPREGLSFHSQIGNTFSAMWHFYFWGVTSFIWICLVQVECHFDPGLSQLVIEVHTIRPTSVDLSWTTLHANASELQNSAHCNVIIWTSIDRRQVLENYNLQNHIIHVKYLEEKTQYALFLSCQVNGTAFHSNVVDFVTGSQSPLPVSSTPLSNAINDNRGSGLPVTEEPLRTELSHTGGGSEDGRSKDPDSPTIYKHKLNAFSNVLDATLGIIFAAVGSVVALVTGCYVYKGWRRRQRFQRFMRHRDSSDQFDIIRQNIAESS